MVKGVLLMTPTPPPLLPPVQEPKEPPDLVTTMRTMLIRKRRFTYRSKEERQLDHHIR